ncbi:MAG: DNA polymerase III subunit alpha [Brevinematia bacterium]
MKEFVHLHVHTEYSLLDGANKISELVSKAKEYGMPSLAITDHGNLFGSIEFYKVCKDVGIKPIVGVEAYLTEDMHKKEKVQKVDPYSLDKQYSHITLLAKDIIGYKNLVKMVTKSYTEGFYYKPRIDKKLLEEHRRGIIVLSGCIAGEIPQLLLRGNFKEARRVADWYISTFGRDNFYIEIQRHDLDEEKVVNPALVKLAKDTGVKIVATGDAHYLRVEDAKIHDVLLCIQTNSRRSDPNRFRFPNNTFYLKSPEEMWKDFADFPEALLSSIEISEKCNLEIPFGNKELMPKYYDDNLEGSVDEKLKEMIFEGLLRIFGDNIPQEYIDRANYEFEVIKSMGFSNYFLVVQDFVNWARRMNIPVGPGRGSAAGALIAYALGITQVDPIRYNLLFERFLNPERITMPDIDVDVADRDREKVIKYLTEKYGKENTANIITFGTLQPKAAIRDVGRVLGIQSARIDSVAKAISNVESVSEARTLVSEVREICEGKNDLEKEWIDIAEKLEGIVRHASIHASGIVISSIPIHEFIAFYRDPKEEVISTQISAQYLEELGFLKMDILGLANLSVIQDTVELIMKTRGIEIDISQIPLDDPKTYELLSSGRTDGVFQVESEGMKEMLKRMKPSCIEDIIAALALYRPGPLGSGMDKQYINRKHGAEKVEYPHPDLEEILKETYGVILYQEQIMKIAQKISGFSLGQADNLRRAIGKKKKDIMDQMKNSFVEGAVKNGYDEKFAQELFDTIEKFAEYGFNKSHSTTYAMITYQTAYLKAHYPLEYMTALINSEIGKFDKMMKYVMEAKRMGIKILPPDVNRSRKLFEIEKVNGKLGIRYGFMGIKGFGESTAEEIIAERDKGGQYKTIDEFFERTHHFLKKNSYEILVKSGALDSLFGDRGRLLAGLEKVVGAFSSISRDKEIGQNNLFLQSSVYQSVQRKPTVEIILSSVPSISRETLSGYEKETIGMFLSHDPLKEYWKRVKYLTSFEIDYVDLLPEGCRFTILGMISEVEKKDTIKGKIANIRVINPFGKEISLYLSTSATREYSELIVPNNVLLFKGIMSKGTSGKMFPKVVRVVKADEYKKDRITELHIILSNDTSEKSLTELRTILKENFGKCISYVGILGNGRIKYYKLSPAFTVKPSVELSSRIRELVGVKAFWYF